MSRPKITTLGVGGYRRDSYVGYDKSLRTELEAFGIVDGHGTSRFASGLPGTERKN